MELLLEYVSMWTQNLLAAKLTQAIISSLLTYVAKDWSLNGFLLFGLNAHIFSQTAMSTDTLKKRKSKVLRGEGATPETKRGRGEGEQVSTKRLDMF